MIIDADSYIFERPDMWLEVDDGCAQLSAGDLLVLRGTRHLPASSERRTADQPVGVRHVLVNGVPIRVDGASDTAAPPGDIVVPGPRT